MMREIKFRAWDSSFNLMRSWENIKDHCNWNIFNSKYLYPMQYTGIKDKNGQEIYEGDILKFICGYHDDQYNEKIERIGEVFFKTEGSIDYCIKVKKQGNFCLNSYDDEEYEVIGNIHENPELLEAE